MPRLTLTVAHSPLIHALMPSVIQVGRHSTPPASKKKGSPEFSSNSAVFDAPSVTFLSEAGVSPKSEVEPPSSVVPVQQPYPQSDLPGRGNSSHTWVMAT